MANAQIVFEGDSRSNADPWTAAVYNHIEPRFGLTLGYAVFAVSGGTFTTLADHAAAVDATLIPDVANILVVWIGVNHWSSGGLYGMTAEQMHTALASYCGDRKTAGWYVVVCTEISASESYLSGWDAKYKAYNTLIRANYTDYADRLIDFGANPILSDWSTYGSQYYWDNVHPNVAGNRVLASVAIPEIIGGTPAVVSLVLELEALGLITNGTE